MKINDPTALSQTQRFYDLSSCPTGIGTFESQSMYHSPDRNIVISILRRIHHSVGTEARRDGRWSDRERLVPVVLLLARRTQLARATAWSRTMTHLDPSAQLPTQGSSPAD